MPAEATGTQTSGTITVAEPPNSAPTWILPIVTGAANSVYTVPMFDYQMFRPLYWFFNGVEPKETPAMSLANDPTWTNGNKTVTFTLKSNYKWSDGTPITSKDVLFWWYEMKAAIKASPANWAFYTPEPRHPGPGGEHQRAELEHRPDEPHQGGEPDLVLAGPAGRYPADAGAGLGQVLRERPDPGLHQAVERRGDLQLPFAPVQVAVQLRDQPALADRGRAVQADLLRQHQRRLHDDAQRHVRRTARDQASRSSSAVSFTSDTAEFNAVKAGKVDVGYVPLGDVPQVASLSATYNEFGYSDFGWSYVAYNFKDPTGDFNNIIGQLYVRQAVAHLEDQAGYIKAFFNGAGGQAYGPVPSIPQSPYTPANAMTNPYPFNPASAEALLKDNGWSIVPNGTDTCVKAGTGAGECGAGIPAGTKLEWSLVYGTSPAVIGEQVQDLASEAKKIGMTINLSSSNFDYMIANYNDPSAPKTISKWAMEDFGGFTNSTYPTTFGVFNSQGSSNLGGYADPKADTLITASINSPAASAVTNEAAYLTTQQPGLFQPNPDSAFGTSAIVVWQKTISGTPESFESLTQAQWNPEYWFFTK